MTRQKKEPFDPLAAQPRPSRRRPGRFDADSRQELDPNVMFEADHSRVGGADPTAAIGRLGQWLGRRFASRRRRDEGPR